MIGQQHFTYLIQPDNKTISSFRLDQCICKSFKPKKHHISIMIVVLKKQCTCQSRGMLNLLFRKRSKKNKTEPNIYPPIKNSALSYRVLIYITLAKSQAIFLENIHFLKIFSLCVAHLFSFFLSPRKSAKKIPASNYSPTLCCAVPSSPGSLSIVFGMGT